MVEARAGRQREPAACVESHPRVRALARRIGAIVVENGDGCAGGPLLPLRLFDVLEQNSRFEAQTSGEAKREVRSCRNGVGATLLAIDIRQVVIPKPVRRAKKAGGEQTAAERRTPGPDADR